MKGLFIVLEGIDGSGKSTQADRLLDYCEARGKKAVLSPEPTAGPIGQLIRQGLGSSLFPFTEPQQFGAQMGYLFAADRHYHLYHPETGVFARLAQGEHVIATRYWFSSLAYNAHTKADWAFVKRLNQNFPDPDWVIFLDLPVTMALQRIGDRQQKQECYEQADKLTTVARNYARIFQDYPSPLCHCDATRPREEIHQQIITTIFSGSP